MWLVIVTDTVANASNFFSLFESNVKTNIGSYFHPTSKFILTSVCDIFKLSNYDGSCHTMSWVVYIIQTDDYKFASGDYNSVFGGQKPEDVLEFRALYHLEDTSR